MDDYAGKKFEQGKKYTSTDYNGNKKIYECVYRNDHTGYIHFREYYRFAERYGGTIRRKAVPGWGDADERVQIVKGTGGRVSRSGGCMLYARDEVKE